MRRGGPGIVERQTALRVARRVSPVERTTLRVARRVAAIFAAVGSKVPVRDSPDSLGWRCCCVGAHVAMAEETAGGAPADAAAAAAITLSRVSHDAWLRTPWATVRSVVSAAIKDKRLKLIDLKYQPQSCSDRVRYDHEEFAEAMLCGLVGVKLRLEMRGWRHGATRGEAPLRGLFPGGQQRDLRGLLLPTLQISVGLLTHSRAAR